MNGFINYRFSDEHFRWERQTVTTLLPVLFTTASLLIAVGDLSSANLKTGELPPDWGEVREVDWLWYTYNQSPALRHRVGASVASPIEPISRAIVRDYSRTIAVVSPSGIDAFLGMDFLSWLS